MKLITSEMDAEAEKWDDPHNEIVRRAKNMSSMAFAMYLFTRGEGPLKTTQDLFTQAEYFAEEGVKLFKIVKDFSLQVWHQQLLPCVFRLSVVDDTSQIESKSKDMASMQSQNKIQEVLKNRHLKYDQ